MPLPIFEAMAAPVIPSSGKGPIPKIRHGSRNIFSVFAISSTLSEMAASPALLKTAWMMNNIMITVLPPIIQAVYPDMSCAISCEIPININSSGAKNHPVQAIMNDITRPVMMD